MGRCDGAAPLLTHHRVVLSAPAEDGWGPPSQRSPVQPVRPEGTAGMPKRPFPRPGVCVTGVSRPATMAIPFLAADTGVTSGLWRVGRPTPGHRSLLNQRRLQCRLPGGTGQEGRVSESSGHHRPGVPGASSSSLGSVFLFTGFTGILLEFTR